MDRSEGNRGFVRCICCCPFGKFHSGTSANYLAWRTDRGRHLCGDENCSNSPIGRKLRKGACQSVAMERQIGRDIGRILFVFSAYEAISLSAKVPDAGFFRAQRAADWMPSIRGHRSAVGANAPGSKLLRENDPDTTGHAGGADRDRLTRVSLRNQIVAGKRKEAAAFLTPKTLSV